MIESTKLGQRHTAQRDAIVSVITAADGPLTVNEIFEQAQAERPNLGIATVYRTIKLLMQSGQIKAIALPDGETRYEPTGLEHHCHFRCTACGRVFDLPGCVVTIPNGSTTPEGYFVESHNLTLQGLCPQCVTREQSRRIAANN